MKKSQTAQFMSWTDLPIRIKLLLSLLSMVFIISLAATVIVVQMSRVSDSSAALLKDQLPRITQYMTLERDITEEMDAVALYIATNDSAQLDKFQTLSAEARSLSKELMVHANEADQNTIRDFYILEEEWQQQINNKVIPLYKIHDHKNGRMQWENSKETGNRLKQEIFTFFHGKENEVNAAGTATSKSVSQTIRICFFLILISFFSAILLAVWLSRHLIRPIENLSEKVDALAAGQMDIRAEVGSDDEIGKLAANFNKMAISLSHMLKQLETANSELVTENEQSLEKTRLKSEFLAMVSHELRTPIHSIMGFSEVLLEEYSGPLSEKQRHYVSYIKRSGEHILSLINDLLDLSKIEAGKMELNYSAIRAPEFVRDVLVLVEQQASEKGIQLFSHSEGEGQIWADERKIKQILLNLLSNAVKFTLPGGQIGLDALVGAGMLTFTVWDTGIGIPAKHLEDIFSEFFQGKDPDPDHTHGTGLGLALTKRLVVLQGGTIHVESTVGAGSRFTVILPVQSTTSLLPRTKEHLLI